MRSRALERCERQEADGEKTTWLWQWIRHVGAPGGRDMAAGGRCGPGGPPTMIIAPRQVKVTGSHLPG